MNHMTTMTNAIHINGAINYTQYLEGYEIEFKDGTSRAAFEAKLLEPTAEGEFGNVCWAQFEAEHPDWSEDDQEAASLASWAGGGFCSLPTVELMRGGTVAFISETQAKALESNPWVCINECDGRVFYISTANIDATVVIPDAKVSEIVSARS